MTNPQLAAICSAFLAGSLFVVGTNVLLVRSRTPEAPPARRTRIAMIPQWKGDAYFRSAREGAEEAACELDVDLVWEGPNSPDATEQLMMLQAWNVRPVDAIAVAVADQSGGSLALRKFHARKIPVVTWDSDAEPDARDIFTTDPNPRDLGYLTVYAAARLARRELAAEAEKIEAGRLGSLEVCGGVIMIGRESRTHQ